MQPPKSFASRLYARAAGALAGTLAVLLMITGQPPPAEATTATAPSAEAEEIVSLIPDSLPVQVGRPDSDGIAAPSTGAGEIVASAAGGETVEFGLPVADSARAQSAPNGGVVYVDPKKPVEVGVQRVDMNDVTEVDSAVRSTVSILGADAPTRYEFSLDLPAGTRAVKQTDGSVFVVEGTDRVVGMFAAPWALDAHGNDVPTNFTVVGDKLVQEVRHSGATYPVIADPVWVVPVVIVGVRAAVQIIVKAGTKKAAQDAAKKLAVAQAKKAAPKSSPKVKSVSPASEIKMRSYTQANLRHNLVARTGKNPKGCQAHHTLPVKFATLFQRAGVQLHNPAYAVWWVSTAGTKNNHASKAAEYNRQWEAFFKRNKKPSAKQILDKRAALDRAYRQFYRC